MIARSGAGVVKEILPNGLRVIAEPLREFSSVSIGIWILAGSRDEETSQSGISHLIEHLTFKGTSRRTARQIALEIDSLGGSLNAFTSKEFTSFYARVLGDSLSQAMDVLADITLNSVFAARELSKEKDVILQEISMVEDTPDDLIHDLHCQEFWADQGLGRPVLGTQSSLKSVGRDQILDFHANRYRAGQMLITASGALEPESFFSELKNAFGDLEAGDPPAERASTTATPGICVRNRPVEQVHCCIGYEGLAADDERRYGMYLLNTRSGRSTVWPIPSTVTIPPTRTPGYTRCTAELPLTAFPNPWRSSVKKRNGFPMKRSPSSTWKRVKDNLRETFCWAWRVRATG
jgi:predicted Zn-dependent peptidase